MQPSNIKLCHSYEYILILLDWYYLWGCLAPQMGIPIYQAILQTFIFLWNGRLSVLFFVVSLGQVSPQQEYSYPWRGSKIHHLLYSSIFHYTLGRSKHYCFKDLCLKCQNFVNFSFHIHCQAVAFFFHFFPLIHCQYESKFFHSHAKASFFHFLSLGYRTYRANRYELKDLSHYRTSTSTLHQIDSSW